MRRISVVIGSSLGAIGSSLAATVTAFCCVGPAVVAVLGTGGMLAAARLAPYRPYFLLGSLVMLALAFWMAYRPQGGCLGKTCATRSAKATRALLWLALAVTVAAALVPEFIQG
ncbi:MAG: hypothetical protein IRZ03_02015 [Acidobacterium ailaaui]|nr:hypothetical protein [Pseudacidobacterium ailaaui]